MYDVIQTQPLSKQCAAKYILDLSEAIALCHANEIIHRDIKPDNFLLGFDGRIKIADFGVSGQDSRVLPHQTYVGTKGYTAPEILYEDTHNKRADIWLLMVNSMVEMNFSFEHIGGNLICGCWSCQALEPHYETRIFVVS